MKGKESLTYLYARRGAPAYPRNLIPEICRGYTATTTAAAAAVGAQEKRTGVASAREAILGI